MGFFDIFFLSAFVSADQQEIHRVTFLCIINTISWPCVNTHFHNALPNAFMVAKASSGGQLEPGGNTGFTSYIFKLGNPDYEFFRSA